MRNSGMLEGNDYDPTNVAITGGTITIGLLRGNIAEIVQAASETLTVAELKGNIITNYGQTTENNLQALPVAVAGLHFLGMCGTTQGSHYFRFQANTSDKIYLNGTGGNDNGYVEISAAAIGACIYFFTFKTSSTTYDWVAITYSGTWVAG